METYGLVGREAVLRELRTGVDDLTRGRGRLMLITGEPGMGKSALMWAAVELAEGTNVRTATAYCVPDGGAPPLWCWTQVLQDLRAAGEDLDPWLVGRLLELGPETESSMSIGADQRFRLHEAIAAALRRAAGGGLTVAIDDLQWADDESVTLLGFLARRLARGPVLLLATCRDAEAGPAYGPLAARADVLGLSALDDAAIAELITRIQGSRPEPAVVAAVHEQAGGNPLFVRELTRLAMGVGGWTTLQSRAGQAVPDRIAGLLRERLARLSESTRRVLAVAALIGRAGSAELLAVVLKESVDAALVAVDEAVMARVLRRGDQGSGWAFLHDLYRSVLTADLPAPRRAELHAAIGEALELRGSAGAQPLPAATLATHFLGAGESCRAKARTYSRRAAAEATARFGHAEAVRHLEQALRLTDATERADRAELILELGVARHRAGDRAGAEAAFRQLTSSVDDPVSLSRAALGLAALEVRSGTPVDDNVAVIRRAIRALEHDAAAPAETGLLALLHAALARELVHADLPGDLGGSADPRPAAESAAERAIDLAERAGDRHAMAMALLARHDAIWRPGTGTARLQVINDLLVAAEAAGDPDLAAEGLLLRSAALIEIGDPDGVSELRRFTERAEHLGHARGHWLAMSRRATLATLTGELDRAGRLAADALEFGREIGVPDAYGCFGTTMVSLGAQGQPSPMDPPPDGDPVARYATLLLAICQPDVDHGPAVRAVPFSVFGIARDLESRAAGALAFARWGSLEQCRDLEHDLAAYTGSQIVIGGCAAFYGPVDYYLGRLAEARGDPALARSRFQTAAEQAGRLGASSWVEQSRAALAAASADRPATGAEWVNEGATWRLNYAGSQIHLPDAKGLRDLAMLIAAPGRELHVFTLLGRDDPAVGADPVLDDEARRQYRRRMAQLQDDIERADRSGDADASDSASRELDAIMRELSTATGLGGRTRRLGDEVERARKTVSARVHDSLDRISVIHPALGAHLSASVTLGARCSYRPIQPVRWLVRGGDSASNS